MNMGLLGMLKQNYKKIYQSNARLAKKIIVNSIATKKFFD